MGRSRFAVVLVALALSGCAAGGYYDAAVKVRTKNSHAAIEYIALCLAEDPTHQKALDLLDDIATRIGDEHRARLESFEKSGDYEDAVADCDRLIASSKLVADLPGNKQIPVSLEDRTRFARLAAKKFYDEGAKLEKEKQRKLAAIAFRRAIGFVEGYEDAAARYDANRRDAVKRVAVAPFGGARGEGQRVAPSVTAGLIQALIAKNPEFLDVLEAKDARGRDVQWRLDGSVNAVFKDSGWSDKKFVSNEKVVVNDANGAQRSEPKATWMFHVRSTKLELFVNYELKDQKSGTIIVAASKNWWRENTRRYIDAVHGDANAVAEQHKKLGHERVEPMTAEELTPDCVAKVSEAIADEIFAKMK